MADILQNLLQRIEDGTASSDELDQARALLDAQDWGVSGAVVRDAVREAAGDDIDVVPGVFEALGLEALAVGDAVRDEAGSVDVTAGVFAALREDGLLEDEGLGQLREAVLDEAGAGELADGVFAALGLDAGLPLAEALHDEAGSVDVSAGVMAAVGAESAPIAEAVRSEAGEIDIADAVMASLARPEAIPTTPVAAPVQPAPANNTRTWIAAVFAAAMVAVVLGVGGIGSLVGGGLLIGSQVGTDSPAPVQVASNGGSERLGVNSEHMVFASTSEVVVEELSFGDDVVVFQDEGDDGALILWVDEEVL